MDVDHRTQSKRRLSIVLILTTAYLAAEVAGGIWTHSLALLADAGHMLTDVGGIALALVALRFAERPATPERTYGYHRVEILAALANAVVLLVVSLFILFEAYQRFRVPTEVASRPMLVIAVVGLAINLAGMKILHGGSSKSLNVQGAYFEILADTVASIGVIAAAAVIWITGWRYADPLISAGIGLFIFPRTWKMLKEVVGVLLEGTPSHINLASLRESLSALPGVVGVHDLHVWTLTSDMNAMSVHVVAADKVSTNEVLQRAHDAIASAFAIGHATVQVESASCPVKEVHL